MKMSPDSQDTSRSFSWMPSNRAMVTTVAHATRRVVPALGAFWAMVLIPLAVANPSPQPVAGFQTPQSLPSAKQAVALHELSQDERWMAARQLCRAGSPDDCYRAGRRAVYAHQFVSAYRLFLSGCRSGHLDSCLSIQFVNHSAASPSVRESWVRRAISALEESCPGDMTACANLGHMLVYREVSQAIPHLETACREGHLKSCRGLRALAQARRRADGIRIEAPSFE